MVSIRLVEYDKHMKVKDDMKIVRTLEFNRMKMIVQTQTAGTIDATQMRLGESKWIGKGLRRQFWGSLEKKCFKWTPKNSHPEDELDLIISNGGQHKQL